MQQVVHESFDAKTVELQNSNLIEASAGTGKTFSIALLLIRLIVEKGIPIEKILMVTFTKAAVAELELRVRSFVRAALQNTISGNYSIQEDPVCIIIQNGVASIGRDKVVERLKTATLFLDELAVMTIHSFCQKTLSEYSFETNQTFGAENMSPDEFSELTEDFFNQFWRKYITTLDLDLLKDLIGKGLSREVLINQVKNILRGQKTIGVEYQANSFDFNNTISILDELVDLKNNIKTVKDELIQDLTINKPKYLQSIAARGNNAQKAFGQLYEENKLEELIEAIKAKSTTGYCINIFSDTILPLINTFTLSNAEFNNRLILIISQIGELAAAEVAKKIKDAKKVKGFITFDDMIELLHEAVVERNNPSLRDALRLKYQAVFIDEFQDTDKLQYGIFNTLFGDNHTLFYIGDPKQSIYGFRKADINTYLKASQQVDNLYRMNTNFRSNAVFIKSMNCFFKPTPSFDTFALDTTPPPFEYISVNSPENNQKGYLIKNGERTKTLSISTHKQNNSLLKGVVSTVIQLLNKKTYKIQENNNIREVKPSDIGIVVRTNNEGRSIKASLSKFGIPSITVDDSKLLSSEEAIELCYILEAVSKIEQGAINKALLTKIAGYNIDKLLASNEEEILARFRQYQDDWKEKGVFVMLKEFISDHELSSRLLREEIDNGERLVSNILQLIEIINNVEVKKQLDNKELIQWLKKGIEGSLTEGDEFEQRIESDEDAIKIVTIHKCKGLEYNIVLAPSLDLISSSSKHTTISFRNPDDSCYYNIDKKLASDSEIKWAEGQAEQENRRLLYVAITRARMQCYIYSNNYKSSSCLKQFLNALNLTKEEEIEIESEHWEKWVPKEIDYSFRYFSEANNVATNYATISTQTLPLLHPNWRKTSYSGLNPEHTATFYPNNTVLLEDDYEKFALRDLKKGAHTGNLLHYIFENLNFTNAQYWEFTIQKALNRVFTINKEDYVTHINQLLTHVTEVSMPVNILHPTNVAFSLKDLTNQSKLNELEFDFPLKPFNTERLRELSTDKIPFRIKSFAEIEGIMNGKMDLFFKINEKYYILDWKSNFLGETLDDYNQEKVATAMGENNYHLQYHLYTLAAKKYISHCISDFDYDKHFGGVIYIFLRGVRSGTTNGLFLHRPESKIINDIERIIC